MTKNMQCFAENMLVEKEQPKELQELLDFTTYDKNFRNQNINVFQSITKEGKGKRSQYFFNYQGKKYPFSVFSDNNLQKKDQELLKEKERYKIQLLRTLKLACSMELVDPRVAIGNSLIMVCDTLILFREEKTDKVISYSSNLVMDKDDFYEIFEYQEINVVDKADLYFIYWMMKHSNSWVYTYEYLIFTKEIFKELSKNECFPFLSKKYNGIGISYRNMFLFDGNCDSIFFQEDDRKNRKYHDFIKELRDFTKNPTKDSKHISYHPKKDNYQLNVGLSEPFRFSLLSDKIEDEELKDMLLSNKRYRKCYENAIKIANSLDEETLRSAYIVAGKCKINEIDYYYHSWIEIEDKNLVIDFNNNIVMNRNQYYQLFESKLIHRTPISEMNKASQTIVYDVGLDFHPFYLNYFGSDMARDLQKNEKIFSKK